MGFKVLLLTFNILCGADTVTTVYGIQSDKAREAFWPIQSPTGIIAINSGQCVAVTYGSRKLPKKVAIPLLIGSIVVRGWAVGNNINVLRSN